jgi:predicted AAA+ superfamily ATPase
LQDTLIGNFLPAFIKRPKRRIISAPKFYFHDIGIVNYLSGQRSVTKKTSQFGKAFENWIYHELQCFEKYSHSVLSLSYWQLTGGVEVDFIINDMKIAIEAKSSSHINDSHLKNLRELKKDHPEIKERLIVCLEKHSRITDDNIHILTYSDFIKKLWSHPLKPNTQISFY